MRFEYKYICDWPYIYIISDTQIANKIQRSPKYVYFCRCFPVRNYIIFSCLHPTCRLTVILLVKPSPVKTKDSKTDFLFILFFVDFINKFNCVIILYSITYFYYYS